MPQLVGSDQSTCVGRGQRLQVENEAKVYSRVGRLSRSDHHRGADTFRRNGRVVQPGETHRQIGRLWCHSPSHQRRNQRRRKGSFDSSSSSSSCFFFKVSKLSFVLTVTLAGGTISRAIHLSAREPVSLPVGTGAPRRSETARRLPL